MKIEELKEKQQEVFERVTKKYPHLICVMVGREIETEGDKVIFEFKPGEEMLRKIADRYLGDLFEGIDEKPTNSFLYSLVMDPYSIGFHNSFDMPLNHKVFLASFDAIKDIASKGPCVIVGRCADYALSEYSNLLSVFIYAELEQRIQTIMKRNGISKEKAKDLISKTDKQRASYYNYYSTKRWGDLKSYHLCIDSGIFGLEGSVDIIKHALEL